MSAIHFYPERRHPIRRLLLSQVFDSHGTRNRNPEFDESSQADTDEDTIETPRRRLPTAGGNGSQSGIRLWQLLALMFALFAAHYTLVKITISDSNKDLKYELLRDQQNINNAIVESQRRVSVVEDVDRAIQARLTAHEIEDRDRERRITLLEERQRVVMSKIGLRP